MKNTLLFLFALLFITTSASAWGPDQLVNSVSPQGKVVSVAKSTNEIYTAIPATSQPGYSVLIFSSTDGGLNWNPVSYTGAGNGTLPLKMKAIRAADSVYVYFLVNDSIYHINLETGVTNVVPLTYQVYDFDIAPSTVSAGVYLYYMPVNTDDIRRVSSADRGLTWNGSSASVTTNGLRPSVAMYGQELILNYFTSGPVDTTTGVIRAAHYHESSAGQLATGSGGFKDIVTSTASKRIYQSVVYANNVWFFWTEMDANGEQLNCMVSGNLNTTYSTPFNLNPNPLTESIFTFDATYNDGPISGCDVYYMRHANGSPAFSELMIRSALTISTTAFSTEVQISNHTSQAADPRYLKPAAVQLPGVTEHAVVWDSNIPGADQVYFDRESFATGLNSIDNESTLELYPSPAKDFVNIKSDLKETCNVEVFNLQGQTVLNVPSVQINSIYKLDISNLINGNYILRLTTNEGAVYSGRISKND